MNPLLRTLLVVGLVLATGCVTAQGEVPPPPTDADLQNDGSRQSKLELIRRYRVHVLRDRVLLGDAVRPIGGFPPTMSGLRPDAEAYVASNARAAAELPGLGHNVHQWVVTGAMLAGAAVLAVVGLIAFGAYYFVRFQPSLAAASLPPILVDDPVLMMLPFVVGALLLLPLQLYAVVPLWLMDRARERAAANFNEDLFRRIDANVRKPDTLRPSVTKEASSVDPGLPATDGGT